MRVKIESEEKRDGFIFKRPFVDVLLTVDFSHEETQIIRQRQLLDEILLERVPANAKVDDDPNWYALRVKHLLERKPDRHRCATPGDAKAYRAQLEAMLHGLKAALNENAEIDGDVVFEL